MPDFYQHRHVATLHQLTEFDLQAREAELDGFRRRTPICLILPALFSEFEQPALPRILDELRNVGYLGEIVLSMNRMDAEQFVRARDAIRALPQRARIIWNDGPRVSAVYERLAESRMPAYLPGKGFNVWMAWGYALARGTCRVLVTHDSDILSYHREMLMRLCLPVTHPHLGYEFCKSYYGRVTDRLYGRVTRLFVSPLLRALMQTVGPHPLLEFLDGFRYPLSGEFALSADLARMLRVPGDWGLEVGMLCEAYRNTTTARICQIDLGSNFEHKHQHLGHDPGDPEPSVDKGLTKMAREVALTLFANLASEGVTLGCAELETVRRGYLRMAKEAMMRYHDDAVVNGLHYFRNEEADAVEAFARALESAARTFSGNSCDPPHLPNWTDILAAREGLSEQLLDAVERDHGD